MLTAGERPLKGKVVVVTGATGGIGSAVALAARDAGCRVVAVGRNGERLDALVQAPGPPGALPPIAITADVCRDGDVEAVRDRTVAELGRIDALVAAHGVGRRPDGSRVLPHPFSRLPLEEWRTVLETNLFGTFLVARAVIPAMRRQGDGAIVFIGSARGGRRGQAFGAAYCASKFALRGLAESLAEEVERDGIRVTLLQPEAVRSPLIRDTRLGTGRLGAMAPQRMGELVVSLLAMPSDLRLPEPVFTAFGGGLAEGAEAREVAP